VVGVIEMFRVGEHTQIVRHASQTTAEVAAILEQGRRRLTNGRSWFLSTPYGGFGGSVRPGQQATVRRVSRLDELRSLSPTRLRVPTCLHRDAPVRFDHAYLAPGGIVLVFFGSGAAELLLAQFPVDESRSVTFSRSVDRTTPEGEFVMESPELKAEELSLGGQSVVWDPDPELAPHGHRSESSALRWEEDGASYSLMGRSLTREEAVDLFLSLRSLDERP
jgi:hypothetical protein